MWSPSEIKYQGILSFIIHGILSPASIALLIGYYISIKLYKEKTNFKFLKFFSFKKLILIIKSNYKFDELFLYISLIMKKSSLFFSNKMDIALIDGFIVNGIPKRINILSSYLRTISSGYLYHYAFLIVLSLVIIFAAILVRIL